MSQATNVIPLPVPKLSFEPVEMNIKKMLTRYDERRNIVLFAMKILTMTPAQLRVSVDGIQRNADDTGGVEKLLDSFEEVADAFGYLVDLMGTAHARLTAVNAKLI